MKKPHALVTGGAGFIGSHLTEYLLSQGQRVTVIDNESTGNRRNLASVWSHLSLTYIQADVADESLLGHTLPDIQHIYHLAASVGVKQVADRPVEMLNCNLKSTETLLRLASESHQQGFKKQVFIASSSEVYGKNPQPKWHEEDDMIWGPPTKPRYAYGLSKSLNESMAIAYHRQFDLPVWIARFFNIVGPRQTGRYGMVLPRFVDAALSGKTLHVHDDGQQTRCFAHVRDIVPWLEQLMRLPQAVAKPVNIGSDLPITIARLAEEVVRLSKSQSQVEAIPFSHVYGEAFEDIRHRVPDLSRLKSWLNVGQVASIEEIILDMIEHY